MLLRYFYSSQFQNGGQRSRFFGNEFFLQDSGPASQSRTSVSGKTECLLATIDNKRANLLKSRPLSILKVFSQGVGFRTTGNDKRGYSQIEKVLLFVRSKTWPIYI